MAPPPPSSASLSAPIIDRSPEHDFQTQPIAVVPDRLPWRHTFISLKVPNYRLFVTAHFIAVIALWMQRIAQDWLVLELSGSVAAVGITVAMQFLPTLLLGPIGGMIADRFPKRVILMVSQGTGAILATAMAVLALTGTIKVWHIYVLALGLGLATVIDQPARQVFVNELVGPKYLRNAISLNMTTFQLGGLIGPALSGVLLTTLGGGWSFAANAVACTLTVIMLSLLRKDQLIQNPPAPKSKGMLREGLRYAVGKPTIVWPAVMCAFVAVFAMSLPVLLAAFADHIFNTGAGGYGLLNTSVALGALGGAVASTRRRALRLRSAVFSAGAYGLVLVVAAFAPSMVLLGIAMVAGGFCSLLFLTAANQLVQMSANLTIRGRVMSLYIMVLMGGQAIGGPVMGWLAEHLGPHATLFIAGAVPAVAATVIALVLARRGELTVKVNLRRRRRMVTIVPRTAGVAASTA